MAERRYSITVDGETFAARVEPRDGGTVAVTLGDGDAEPVEVLDDGPTLTVFFGSRVLELAPSGDGGFTGRGGIGIAVEARRIGARTGAAAASSGRVQAPMPGRIVKLLVAPGEHVATGAGLVVMEAMKMENEIGAPHAGTVVRVLVNVGDTVERDAALVELEAP
jgi:acetyl/propionyl-CoA carboxylase alpha subunit